MVQEGLDLSSKCHYQYLNFRFKCIGSTQACVYEFQYSFYPIEGLEAYLIKHNRDWGKKLKTSFY